MLRLVGLIAIGTLLAVAIPGAAQRASSEAERDQRTIAGQLLSENSEERAKALEAARRIGPEASTAPLRVALIALLEKMNVAVQSAREGGIALDRVEDPEFVASVHHVVAGFRDPQSIPALVRALGSFTVIRPLAAFGEQAAPVVLGVVTSPTSHYSAVNDGLRVLRWMVEQQRERPLSPGTMSEIRRAAELRLTGEQYFTVLWCAIDLAAVLDDAGLQRIIGNLAAYPAEVNTRGVMDPDLVEKTQKRAAARLAEVPSRR